jgi:hypothetical protein
MLQPQRRDRDIMIQKRIGYLVCDEGDKSFPNYKWEPGTTHEADNPNYIHFAYKDLAVATMVQPALESIANPRYWEVELGDPSHEDPFRIGAARCTAIKRHEPPEPSDMQRFNFAALMCLNYMKNENFMKWAVSYIDGTDRTPETADALSEKFRLNMCMDLEPNQAYLSAAHPLSQAVVTGNFRLFCANSAHRIIWDSPPGLNVQLFANFAMSASDAEVTGLVKSMEGGTKGPV